MNRSLLLSALLMLGCDETVDELLPQLRSELQPGTELHFIHAETLDASGDNTVSEHWLRVLTDCPIGADGFYDLGSFSIERGDATLAQIRITAYRDIEGKAVPLFEQRSEAVFHGGVSTVPFRFTRACNQGLQCAKGMTCDPDTGSCGAIPRVERAAEPQEMGRGPWCLQRLDVPPPLAPQAVPDAGPVVQCVTGDGWCPTGCDGSRDADCRLSIGKSCTEGGDVCVPGASCVHGVCCEQRCGGTCERCDLPEQLGYCKPLAYTQTQSPLNSPDFSALCEDEVKYTCAGSRCSAECAPDYADCDKDLQANGCETPLKTALNCRSCGESCTYGYCGADGCTWHALGGDDPSSSGPVDAGQLYAIALPVPSGDRRLRALGALVHPGLAGRLLRVALYVQEGTLFKLFAASGEIQTVDNPASQLATPAGGLRVEARVTSPELPANGVFRIAFQVSDTTQLYAEGTQARWAVEPLSFGEFPLQLAPLPSLVKLPVFQVYAVTTPE